MDIPSITQWQLDFIRDLVVKTPTMLLVAPHRNDPKDARVAREKSAKEADSLLTLGLIEDANINDMFASYLQKLQSETGRPWRIFKITEMGLQMFYATMKEVVN